MGASQSDVSDSGDTTVGSNVGGIVTVSPSPLSLHGGGGGGGGGGHNAPRHVGKISPEPTELITELSALTPHTPILHPGSGAGSPEVRAPPRLSRETCGSAFNGFSASARTYLSGAKAAQEDAQQRITAANKLAASTSSRVDVLTRTLDTAGARLESVDSLTVEVARLRSRLDMALAAAQKLANRLDA